MSYNTTPSQVLGTPSQRIHEQKSEDLVKLIQGASVKVYIGNDETLFQLPRALLCHHSGYFDRAFHGMFKEATSHTMYLQEDNPSTFGLLIEWMYTRSLHVYKDHVYGIGIEDLQKALETTCDVLCELFCLSEKLLVDGIQNTIMDELDRAIERSVGQFPIGQATVMAVYHNTHEFSKFRKYVMDQLAINLVDYHGRKFEDYKDCLEGPSALPGFVLSLVTRMKDVREMNFW